MGRLATLCAIAVRQASKSSKSSGLTVRLGIALSILKSFIIIGAKVNIGGDFLNKKSLLEQGFFGGRTWTRTTDLYDVNVTL